MSSVIKKACRFALLVLPPLALIGCTGDQAALRPAGPQASHIAGLGRLYITVAALVYIITMAVMLSAVWKRHRAAGDEPDPPVINPDPVREHRYGVVIATLVGVSTVILFVLMIGDFLTGRAVASLTGDTNALKVRVTAHQWWWEATYFGSGGPSDTFNTANELHIPVGRTVQFELQSADVIHSFWIPRLHGKKDMIPGHAASVYIKADKPGEYWGNCAEFCGWQHAKMRLHVVVEEDEKHFDDWAAAQRQPAPDPTNEEQARGKQVFLGSTCVMCHTITGTTAGARLGPDLTHVGSRQYLAGNWLPNMPGHLAGWIVDPQKIKPGARMPQNSIPPQDLRALLEYLESLK